MKTAVGHISSQALPAWLTQRGAFSAFSRSMLTALVLTAMQATL